MFIIVLGQHVSILIESSSCPSKIQILTENDSIVIETYCPNTVIKLLLYLHSARNKITQLSIPTHAQLQRHRLKFIKTI